MRGILYLVVLMIAFVVAIAGVSTIAANLISSDSDQEPHLIEVYTSDNIYYLNVQDLVITQETSSDTLIFKSLESLSDWISTRTANEAR